ncbi:MAG: hypothetical protein QOI36_5136 [Pseudonocardiales bacterium]|jgi:hypothetical protein|nr:hypothetical protein [Pseudonocardia sp.]MDT7653730.1 hypothetical protein [Pseudonocardiales bacterium]
MLPASNDDVLDTGHQPRRTDHSHLPRGHRNDRLPGPQEGKLVGLADDCCNCVRPAWTGRSAGFDMSASHWP